MSTLEEFKIKEINNRYNFKEDAMEAILEAKKWGWTEDDMELFDDILYSMNHLHKIEGSAKEFFMEIMRTHIYNKIGWIKETSDPMSVISNTDDASFYSDMYYFFT